jgi:hypothetical protein
MIASVNVYRCRQQSLFYVRMKLKAVKLKSPCIEPRRCKDYRIICDVPWTVSVHIRSDYHTSLQPAEQMGRQLSR